MRVASVLLASAILVAPAHAQDPPKSFSCTFASGTAAVYDAGKFAAKDPAPLSFEIGRIDLEAQAAELTTPAGTAEKPLRIVRAINANHFLEAVNEGFLNLTTVYDVDPTTGQHPAVHSRHYGVLGQPVVAHYQGFCKGG